MLSKHPKPLLMLFSTEVWERFSYYGMKSLLMIYLVVELFKDYAEVERKTLAFGVVAAYSALVYATPFFGGWVADKLLGYRKSVMFGAVLMMVGHFLMAIDNTLIFYLALAFLIVGNGFFKPNISTMVGKLYDENDRRRDQGFTIFYMGVNLGAFFAGACGWLGEGYGYHYGFSVAGIGMLIGLITFSRNQKLLNHVGLPPKIEKLKSKVAGLSVEYWVYVAGVLSTALFASLIVFADVLKVFLTVLASGVVSYILIYAFTQKKQIRERLFVLVILLVFSTIFFAFFEQAFTSVTLFTKDNVNRFGIPASVFQSVNPFFIFTFGLVVSAIWAKLASKKKEPNTPAKFSIGLFLLGASFLLVAASVLFINVTTINIGTGENPDMVVAATVSVLFLVGYYFLLTLGELCVSPVGLSIMSKLAPAKMTGLIMGAWYISFSFAHDLSGSIAKLSTHTEEVSPYEIVVDKVNAVLKAEGVTGLESKGVSGVVSESVSLGMEQIVAESKTYYMNSTKEFSVNLSAVADSCLGRLEYYKLIEADENSKERVEAAFADAVEVFVQNGESAVEKAMLKGYIGEAEQKEFTLYTSSSLSNLLSYNRLYLYLGIIACGAGLVLLVLSPFLKKMMHGLH